MIKPFLLFRGPIKTVSGYGAHSRDLLKMLYCTNLFEIKIDSCPWGMTPMTAMNEKNDFNTWVNENIITEQHRKPDIYFQVTIPSEFTPLGVISIGVTAGIETTVAPKDWIEGCNRMDLVITTSNFSKKVLENSILEEVDKTTGQIVNTYKINKPIEVLFEGIDTNVFKKTESNFDLSQIKEKNIFLFLGHWLKGDLGQDRKDIGMLIKTFCVAFENNKDVALLLKTSAAGFSIIERERIFKHIESLTNEMTNPPSIYLLFGELTDNEINDVYNHEKIKTFVTFTKGEGFGRPMLEFTMTGKPVIASNWSGHLDFLPSDKSVLLDGTITPVHDSAIDNFIIKNSKWFTVDYLKAIEKLRDVMNNYSGYLEKSEELGKNNSSMFSIDKMKEEFIKIYSKYKK